MNTDNVSFALKFYSKCNNNLINGVFIYIERKDNVYYINNIKDNYYVDLLKLFINYFIMMVILFVDNEVTKEYKVKQK